MTIFAEREVCGGLEDANRHRRLLPRFSVAIKAANDMAHADNRATVCADGHPLSFEGTAEWTKRANEMDMGKAPG